MSAKKLMVNSSQDTGRGISGAIWGDCPWLEIVEDPSRGWCFHDDFLIGGITPTITTLIAGPGGYSMFGSTGATITYDDEPGGAIVLTESDDNEAVSLGTKQHPFRLSSTAGRFWFEARVKTNTIVTLEQGFFIGLMGATNQSATVPLTATSAIADINCVGFHKPEANTTAFNCSYKKIGATAVVVNTGVGSLAVNSYIKLGMKMQDGQIDFFINGARQASAASVSASDFPSGAGLGPILALICGTNNDSILSMDWWRIAQLAY